MISDNEGFYYPIVEKSECINCGLCELKCPVLNPISHTKERIDAFAYAAYSKDTSLRRKSSSGGVFTEIAQYVLYNKGVIFGAAFDEKMHLKHIAIDSINDLEKLRGSKYVQSQIDTTFQHAKQFLNAGRLVLFTGTPCQIAGLYNFLGKEYDNLITQDIICHGVPSPMVWEKYKQYQQDKMNAKLIDVSFRDKTSGWRTYSISLKHLNQKICTHSISNDSYMQCFLKNLSLRPSCFDCAFKGKHRQSDFTLGDFWGIENVMPQMDDNIGTSLLLVNSAKGRDVFLRIADNLYYEQVDVEKAIPYNTSMISSPPMPPNRMLFMKEISDGAYKKVIRKYLKPKFSVCLKSMLKKILIFIKHKNMNGEKI